MEKKCVDIICNSPGASWRNFHVSLFGLRAPPVLKPYLSVYVYIILYMERTLQFFCFEIQIGKNITSGYKMYSGILYVSAPLNAENVGF